MANGSIERVVYDVIQHCELSSSGNDIGDLSGTRGGGEEGRAGFAVLMGYSLKVMDSTINQSQTLCLRSRLAVTRRKATIGFPARLSTDMVRKIALRLEVYIPCIR
jgi:hypothetical protein